MIMNSIKYFPEGVALGNAFINRENERKYLINRIKSNKHSVLIAPRRYGKTSLVMKVASEMDMAYCSIDLLAAYSEEYVRDQLANKVSRLVFELLPRLNKAKEKLITIFKKMKPEISISAFGQKLSLSLSNSPLQDITELLLNLDATATYFKKRAVIFIDEFQQISQLKNGHSIEAAIRHAVERSENIAYVFSGSNRQLLKQMFGDQGRPLYRLCQTINIERMAKDVYIPHLQHLAKVRWKKLLSLEAIEQIFKHTERHPFYMNVLCQILWEERDVPSIEKIDTVWHTYVKAQKHLISHDITELSLNQRRIITALARLPVKEIQSIEFIAPLKISASSAQQSLEVLISKDLVYRREDGFYYILDPAMKYYLDVVLWEDIG
ncbi:MAG: ATP-binding protein [Gammaproteobacteria bacterium]|nr:MAG: ATP-binding protein [Gammaproteobacteria bacterium]